MFIAANVSVSYGKSIVISNLSLHIGKGNITAILGRNGVGKTTFLKSAMGILPMTAGSLLAFHLNQESVFFFQNKKFEKNAPVIEISVP